MLLLLLLLMTTCRSHKVVDSNEDLSPEHFAITTLNTTLLHPVSNRTDDKTSSASTWKIATSLADASTENATTSKELHLDDDSTTEKPENVSTKFKPSPQEGTLDTFEDNFVVPTSQSYGPFSPPVIRRPPAGLFSSYKEIRHPMNKIPPEIFKHYHRFPYTLESPVLTKTKDDWKPYRPTAEAPVNVPAEVYGLPETPKDRPEFSLDFHGDVREMAFKKRAPPMQGLVRLLAALIPMGILVSALTPGVVTLETTANTANTNSINNNVFRRTDSAGLPAISERCRRRLLCELQLDQHYQRSAGGAGCRHMRCEDRAALNTALEWLLHRPAYAGTGNHLSRHSDNFQS